MVHIDLCTKEGVMKAYAFQTPVQAISLLEGIKDYEFQWFNLDWDGRHYTCPRKFIKKINNRNGILLFRR